MKYMYATGAMCFFTPHHNRAKSQVEKKTKYMSRLCLLIFPFEVFSNKKSNE
jgi:hypothetical protein